MQSRVASFIYGVTCYLVSLVTFVYAAAFLGNFGLPKSIDTGASLPFTRALAIDLALLALFSVQHSVMARPWFKKAWTRIVPEQVERSTYLLFSSVALSLLIWFWQPMGGVVWKLESSWAHTTLVGLYAVGWAIVLYATFLINHFDLFGLRQVWLHLCGKPYTQLKFGTPVLYRVVRHPLYVGWLLVFWSAPVMTAAHLVFAAATTAYILVAIQLEERDLVRLHPEYAEYRRRVPMLVPVGSRGPEESAKPQVSAARAMRKAG